MLALAFDPATLTADLALDESGGLRQDDPIRINVLVSLFTDRRARPDDPLDAGEDRRGWCGDALAEIAGDRIGSRLWLLRREKQTEETRRRAIGYAEEALAWMVEDGLARRVSVDAAWARRGALALDIVIDLTAGGAARLPIAIVAGAA